MRAESGGVIFSGTGCLRRAVERIGGWMKLGLRFGEGAARRRQNFYFLMYDKAVCCVLCSVFFGRICLSQVLGNTGLSFDVAMYLEFHGNRLQYQRTQIVRYDFFFWYSFVIIYF